MAATQPHKLTKRGRQMLRHIVRRDHQVFRIICRYRPLQISSGTGPRELHGMGFHDRAGTSKSYITKCNAKCWMQWCKAGHHWSLELQKPVHRSDESCFFIWHADGRIWVWWLPGERYLSDRIVPSVMFGRGGIMVWSSYSGVGLGSLVPVK